MGWVSDVLVGWAGRPLERVCSPGSGDAIAADISFLRSNSGDFVIRGVVGAVDSVSQADFSVCADGPGC